MRGEKQPLSRRARVAERGCVVASLLVTVAIHPTDWSHREMDILRSARKSGARRVTRLFTPRLPSIALGMPDDGLGGRQRTMASPMMEAMRHEKEGFGPLSL